MPGSLSPPTERRSRARLLLIGRAGLFAGFAILLVVLADIVLVVRRQIDVLAFNHDQVVHAQAFLVELEQTESILADAETGQRGYLYTGDPEYLEPYSQAITRIDAHLDALTRFTADSPRQQSRVAQLRTLAKAKLAEMAQTISLYRAGRPDEARALVKTGKGKASMDNIRNGMARMEAEEAALDTSRTAAYQKIVQLTKSLIVFFSVFAALCLVLLAFYVFRQISLRERHLSEIRRREEWYRVTLTGIGDAVIATDPKGRVIFLNRVAEEMTGKTRAGSIGKDIFEVFPLFNERTLERAANPVARVIENGDAIGWANHTLLQTGDGSRIPVETSAAAIFDDESNLLGVVVVCRDVSGERKYHDALRKTEMLSAAARLSASMAHEINNPLAGVVNLVYLAKAVPGVPVAAIEPLTQAEYELERIAHITKQTLGFYRESSSPGRLKVPPLIDSVLDIYASKFKRKSITVERNYCGCGAALGISGEIKQAISNLISNAIDAVETGGIIRIETKCDENSAGRAMHLLIEDNGPGIPPDISERIFEPFFTTKEDVGTGLGLFVTREIVVRHGGTIRSHRRADGLRGAAFTVVMPCTTDLPVDEDVEIEPLAPVAT
jgi:PAS domain S-box-containing protein